MEEIINEGHAAILVSHGMGKISLTLELPFLPLKPGEYIVTCTISDRKHPAAFLRAAPELTILEDKSIERSGYHGILNLPAKLSVESE